jgi:uncharacterized protein YfbU (UPF0304 family)
MRKRKRDQLHDWELELIREIRTMFRALEASYDRLEDKSGIDQVLIRFDGFDAHDRYESRFLPYVNWMDSHMQRLPYYKRLLQHWRESRDKENLSKGDIVRIVEGSIFRHTRTPYSPRLEFTHPT